MGDGQRSNRDHAIILVMCKYEKYAVKISFFLNLYLPRYLLLPSASVPSL